MSLIGRGVLTTMPVGPFCRVAGAQTVTQPWHTDPLSPNVGCAEAACAPVYARCGAVVEDAGVLGEKLVFYQFAALVCRLVLVPQQGMGVEVASG